MRRVVSGAVLALVVALPGAVVPAAAGSAPVPTKATAAAVASGSSWVPVYGGDFPDPSVSEFDGAYYAYSTNVPTANVPAATSADGVSWTPTAGDILPAVPGWGAAGFTWAPSVGRTGTGGYVMFYTELYATLGIMCIGRATSTSPKGPFTDPSTSPAVCQPALGGSIDPSIFTDTSGRSELLWKSDGNANGTPTWLWSQPLDAGLDLTGSAVPLLTADQPWQGGIVEGPSMVQTASGYDLFYGGNQWESSASAIGYATCTSPLGPCTDSPSNPVLTSAVGMTGPQGPTFFTAPDGDVRMAFDAWPSTVGYGEHGVRSMYEAEVQFTDGAPTFTPVDPVHPAAGYWQAATDGGVFNYGKSQFFGSAGALRLVRPVSGIAADPGGDGYWLVASDGGVFTFGAGRFYGSMGGRNLNAPVVGMASDPGGDGYWLVASDGGVFTFGGAAFAGSMGGQALTEPVVGLTGDDTTGGYWEVASDGGVFAFDAPFFGSTGALRLNSPIVGMAAVPGGGGYWLVAADGGVFAFGDAPFCGSTGGRSLNSPIVGMAAVPGGGGYWLVGADGSVYPFGDAVQYGPVTAQTLNGPVTGIASSG